MLWILSIKSEGVKAERRFNKKNVENNIISKMIKKLLKNSRESGGEFNKTEHYEKICKNLKKFYKNTCKILT